MSWKESVISRDAYSTFVSFVFAGAIVAWGSAALGLNPLAGDYVWTREGSLWLTRPSQPSVEQVLHEEPTADESGRAALAGEATPGETAFVSRGVSYTWQLPWYVQTCGVLYGLVLICFYWIYAEHIIPAYLPDSIWVLPLDLMTLSLMAGAAGAWIDIGTFVTLAFLALLFLTVRCAYPVWHDIKPWRAWSMKGKAKERTTPRDRFMKGLVFVYAVCFAIGIILIIGGVMLGRGGMASVDKVTKYLYGGVQFGMILGVGWTGLYASSYRVPAIGGRGRDPLSPQRKRGVVKPHLVPDYSIIPRERLGKVAAAVFRGEQRYRDLLTVGTGSRDASFHLSQVHSYRDVETQAFIMAHHADDGSSSELREVELRAMWVYLTHWFDDVFDSFRPDELAVLDLQGKFDVGETLGELDERYRRLWECAVNATQATPGVTWNRELLEVGMRRLIHGGPMLSRRCTLRTADCSELHRQYVLDTLEADDPHGIQDLVDRVPGRHLAYTTKVVVEIWDSFQPQASFPSSLLMDFFYAPGLLYHDCEEELSMGEMDSDPEDDPNSYVATLEKTCEVLKALPVPELARMMQPVPMYLSAFQGVIRSSGGIRLLRIYDEFLKDPHVNRALGAPSVPGQGI